MDISAPAQCDVQLDAAEIRVEPKRNKGWDNLIPPQKGEVRNPRGRPKKDLDLAKLAQTHAEKAINTLVAVMTAEDATPSARVSAASEILDRGFGRAPANLQVDHKLGFSEQFEDFIRQMMGGRDSKLIEMDVPEAAE